MQMFIFWIMKMTATEAMHEWNLFPSLPVPVVSNTWQLIRSTTGQQWRNKQLAPLFHSWNSIGQGQIDIKPSRQIEKKQITIKTLRDNYCKWPRMEITKTLSKLITHPPWTTEGNTLNQAFTASVRHQPTGQDWRKGMANLPLQLLKQLKRSREFQVP